MHTLIQLKRATSLFLIELGFVWFGLMPKAQAVSPPPDGGYPSGNTAEGQAVLLSLTTGGFNTGLGYLALRSNMIGSFNTATGAGALLANTANENTATGAGALLSNTMGIDNTAHGAFALFSNIAGGENTAIGHFALFSNTAGALNTANGEVALVNNTTGSINTAIGASALANSTTGSNNVALGGFAGSGVITASNVICIGANVAGADADNSCYIGQIFNATSSAGSAVFINSDGKLGTATSSRRLKQEIRPMEEASEVLFALKPVTFRYKKEIDPKGTPQFGLVAEDVEKVDPDLVVRDKEGNPYSVRYDQVNAMLLNEFLKEHKAFLEEQRKVREHEAKIAQQRRDFQAAIDTLKKDMETVVARVKKQDAKLQKVSTQIEIGSGEPHVALNNR